jgi:hypothetical protein
VYLGGPEKGAWHALLGDRPIPPTYMPPAVPHAACCLCSRLSPPQLNLINSTLNCAGLKDWYQPRALFFGTRSSAGGVHASKHRVFDSRGLPAAARPGNPLGLLCGVGVLADRVSWPRCCCCCRVAAGSLLGLGAGEVRLNSGARGGCLLGGASCRQLWLRSLWGQALVAGRQAGRQQHVSSE